MKAHDELALQQARCFGALRALMRIIVRMSIRVGITYPTMSKLCRQLYVEVAASDFAPTDRKRSISRISLIAGIDRKTARTILQAPKELEHSRTDIYQQSGLLLSAWVSREDCLTDNGDPKPLYFDKGSPSIVELFIEHVGEGEPEYVLKHLVDNGSLAKRSSGAFELVDRYNVTTTAYSTYIQCVGNHLRLHAETIDFNMTRSQTSNTAVGDGIRRFERLQHENIPITRLSRARRTAKQRCLEALTLIDDQLAPLNGKTVADRMSACSGTKSVGVGIFYWEEDS